MPKKLPDDFLPWLDSRLRDLDMNDLQLSQKAKVAKSVISKARSGVQGIGWDAGLAIAQAINIPPEVVLRRLALLPPPANKQHSAILDEMLNRVYAQ
jgi:hypothetical protein